MSNPTTMVIVEPDFLIDASAVAECFTSQESLPEYFIINRLIREPASEKALQGTMVNNILDELIFSPDADYQSLFQLGLAKQPISLVALGLESALNIYNSIKNIHFSCIREFAISLQHDSVQLEPSYINPKYGLQGRLDILWEHEGKHHIVELKSGTPPRYDVWKQHQMQVVAYNMLIRDSYAKTSLGSSSILYSAAGENSFRHVVNTLNLELSLMMCRNRIVGIMHSLAVEPALFFNWLLHTEFKQESGFMKSNLQNIISTMKTLPEHEYEWFLGQLRLIVQEVWLEKTGGLSSESIYGHNSLWQESSLVKKERYRLLESLQVESISFNQIRFRLPQNDLITDFRAGDIVVLYRQKTPLSSQEILRGQISEITQEFVQVLIRGGLNKTSQSFKSDLWALEHDILETSLYSPLSSIFTFMQADTRMRNLFLGLREPETATIGEDIVQRMLSSQDYHIVQGPPGTGKTSGLLSSYIKELHGETNRNILILSFTNRAVDEICLNLRRNSLPFIRTGHSQEISGELMENLVQGKRFEEIAEILKTCRIWVATVQSCNAWLGDLLKLIHIHEIIIDEASQIVENSILGTIVKAEKTILIGDQNQLPPISRLADQSFNYQHPTLDGLFYDSYNQSLMERLNKVCKTNGWNSACSMLHRHYRMHDDIACLIQPYYDGRLVCVLPRQKEKLPEVCHPLLSSRLVWIEFPPSQYAYHDPLQVRCILRIIEIFLQYGIIYNPEKDLGIVAPFRAMIHALLKELPAEQRKITIDTVERFQGSERKNIIITLPLHTSSSLRNIEALNYDNSVDRKLNVAVSRAQERIIVLGNSDICKKSGHYKLLVDKIAGSGNVIAYNDIL